MGVRRRNSRCGRRIRGHRSTAFSRSRTTSRGIPNVVAEHDRDLSHAFSNETRAVRSSMNLSGRTGTIRRQSISPSRSPSLVFHRRSDRGRSGSIGDCLSRRSARVGSSLATITIVTFFEWRNHVVPAFPSISSTTSTLSMAPSIFRLFCHRLCMVITSVNPIAVRRRTKLN